MDLILISILFFRKNDLVSATSLCLATNLKLSPVLLIVAFVLQKDWRWLYYFCLAQLLIIIVTSTVYGYKYWLWFLDFILQNTPPASFRNNSLDSLISNVSRMIGFNYSDRFPVRDLIVLSAKSGALYWIGRVLMLGVKERIFYRAYDDKCVVYNSIPILIIGMMVASPYMWPHHFVFMIFPFILLLSCCKYRSDFTFYVIGYLLIFIVPVFDIFPFSYHRIFGIFMFILILDRWCKRGSYGFSEFVVRVDKKLDELFRSNKEDN